MYGGWGNQGIHLDSFMNLGPVSRAEPDLGRGEYQTTDGEQSQVDLLHQQGPAAA